MQDEKQEQHQISMSLFLGLACGVLMLLLTKGFGERAVTGIFYFQVLQNLHTNTLTSHEYFFFLFSATHDIYYCEATQPKI